VHRFTVGQRHGLGLSCGRKLYVSRIDATTGRVTVGDADALSTRRAVVRGVHWIAGRAPAAPVRARVQVRHRHPGAAATVECSAQGAAVAHFDEPVRAVTPGQAAVFYAEDDDSLVLGGGWIEPDPPAAA
jgi:tRNA-specific 2-thiouridylase